MPFKNFFNRNSAQPSSVSSAAEPALLSPWQAQNGETLDELARFVDFAEGFTIGFLEINFPEDLDNTLKVMQSRRECTGVSFHIFSLGDPNLQFLKDDLENRIQQIPTSVSLLIENKKVIIVKGLENSIGIFDDYPPVLKDLNFVRDAWIESVPYPILFSLPTYAINRVIQYAPDFWSWKSGVFHIQSSQDSQDNASIRGLHAHKSLHKLEELERHERISLLQGLIQDLFPQSGLSISKQNLRICVDALIKLATNLQHIGNSSKALSVLERVEEIFDLEHWLPESEQDLRKKINYLNRRGFIEIELGKYEESKKHSTMALEINEEIIDLFEKSKSLDHLGLAMLRTDDYDKALDLFQRALSVDERPDNRNRSYRGVFYERLGNLYASKNDLEKALDFFEKAITLYQSERDLYNLACALGAAASAHKQANDLPKALLAYQRAFKLWETMGNSSKIKWIQTKIDEISEQKTSLETEDSTSFIES